MPTPRPRARLSNIPPAGHPPGGASPRRGIPPAGHPPGGTTADPLRHIQRVPASFRGAKGVMNLMDIFTAAAANNTETLQILLAQGADTEARDGDGRTPLLLATRANAIEAARLLIGVGADVNAKDSIHDTPYLYAGAEGHLEILHLCLAAGANLKDTNRYGGTALIPACHHGHPETVAELLKTEIAIDHVNRLGWTALMETVILSDGGPIHQDILQQLLAAGADPKLPDFDGATALEHAQQRGYTEMITLLTRATNRS